MTYSFYELAFLFFVYSFLGWLLETVVATVKGKSFANRGFISGPFCVIYGLAGIVLAVMLGELKSSLGFLFLGSALIATALEWICAKLLERLGRRRGFLVSGGEVDTERMSRILLDEYRAGMLGRISLERP